MGKTIEQISNYPFSEGAVLFDNSLLLQNSLEIRKKQLHEYLNYIFEISKDVNFFNDSVEATNTWYDLFKKDLIFQLSSYLKIDPAKLSTFLYQLPLINHFTNDVVLSQDELEKICYQRFQVIFHLFAFFKETCELLNGKEKEYVESIFKDIETQELYARCRHLFDECTLDNEFIQDRNKVNVPEFDGISFITLDESISESFSYFYSYTLTAYTKVLETYPNSRAKFNAANEYLLTMSNQILKTCTQFNLWVEDQLTILTSSHSSHQPHTALLISFCKLMMLFDTRFNRLVHDQTSFIYEDVLKFKRRIGKADMAYVSLELAKNVDTFFLHKDTPFKAGKNSLGKQVFYKSLFDINLNKGEISKIKSCYRESLHGEIFTQSSVEKAHDEKWKVNGSWPIFNVHGSAETGLAFQSHIIASINEKNVNVQVVIDFQKDLPILKTAFNSFIKVSIRFADLSEENLKLLDVKINGTQLTLITKFENLAKGNVHTGVNVFVKFVSPHHRNRQDDWIALFDFCNHVPIYSLGIGLPNYKFKPSQIITQTGNVAIDKPFLAFGSQTFAGANFEVQQPLFAYSSKLDVLINWSEKLKSSIKLSFNDDEIKELEGGVLTSKVSEYNLLGAEDLVIALREKVSFEIESTIQDGDSHRVISTSIPYAIQIKSIEFVSDLYETILNSLNIPNGHDELRRKESEKKQNVKTLQPSIWSLYPLGYLPVRNFEGFKLLPSYNNSYAAYQSDLYIGLDKMNIGQTVSFLFSIDEGTAKQTEKELQVEWFYMRDNQLVQLKDYAIEDTTNHFYQTGIVRFSLPLDATKGDSILGEDDLHYVVARCKEFSSFFPRIRSIQLNAISLLRSLTEDQVETVVSAAPAFIENVFPKVANIKSVKQDLPTFGGLGPETKQELYWRASLRVRHKQRSIQQWDVEHLVLEKFPDIFQVKCFNHAQLDMVSEKIYSHAGHTLIIVIPKYLIHSGSPNFQPALPLSVLQQIRKFIQDRTSAFNRISVMNIKWEICEVDITIRLSADCLDVGFYQQQLQLDIQKFFSPWAFEPSKELGFNSRVLYTASLVDYIDELPYVHHIRELKVYKNGILQNQQIPLSSEAHLFTSATSHKIKAELYAR